MKHKFIIFMLVITAQMLTVIPSLAKDSSAKEYGILKLTNMKEAQKYLEMAADQGYITAQYRLGEITNMAGELDKSEKWYEKAARQGDASTQYALDMMYIGGTGVEDDSQMAAHWLGKAADQGHVMDARHVLGR